MDGDRVVGRVGVDGDRVVGRVGVDGDRVVGRVGVDGDRVVGRVGVDGDRVVGRVGVDGDRVVGRVGSLVFNFRHMSSAGEHPLFNGVARYNRSASYGSAASLSKFLIVQTALSASPLL